MFEALGAFVYRRRWGVLACAGAFLISAIVVLLRGGVLSSGTIEGLEAQRAQRIADDIVGRREETTFVALFQNPKGALDPRDEAFVAAMNAALEPLRSDARVASVTTPNDAATFFRARMRAPNAHAAFALVAMRGDYKEALRAYAGVRQRLGATSGPLTITCTGQLPFMHDLDETLEHDLLRAEAVSLPLALLVLLFVFRTAVAAALPVGVGGLAVAGGVAVVLVASQVMDVASYTINVCSLVGLGVAIDYSLFFVSRYREELADGRDVEAALVRATATAGRVVAFSGVAVGTGLVGLFFFRGSYLFTMGLGGSIVVALSVVFALTFLPALLAVLGPRIQAGRVLRAATPKRSFARALAVAVMKRPVPVLVATLALLALLGAPFGRLRLASTDVRVLPHELEARRGYDELRAAFPSEAATRVVAVVTFPTAPALTRDRIAALWDASRRFATLPHVVRVESIVDKNPDAPPDEEPPGKEDLQDVLIDPPPLYAPLVDAAKRMTVGDRAVVLQLVVDAAPESEEARAVVRALRADRRVGSDGELVVGGRTAVDVDTTAFIVQRTPRAIALVVAVTLVVLFLLLRSVLLPLKAVVMNVLSIAGSFGALVWLFQEGHLFVRDPRPLEPALPVLLFCVLFGLSMDYEVLMLSRMKEAWESTGDNERAVADGLERSAGLITSAAAIMVAVFSAFALARVVLIQAVGVGMALAVALDATVVRALLVPATMRLFGRYNWWPGSPGRMRR